MTITTSKTREQFPLSKKKIIKKTISSSMAWIILFILFSIFEFAGILPVALNATDQAFGHIVIGIMVAVLFLFLVIIYINYLYQRWYFKVYYYELEPDFIVIRKGPITPHEINMPYERVQDVYVDQDFLDRLFGLYDVHLSSATYTSGMEAHIDGVEKPAADGLRALLLQTLTQKISKNKPQQTTQTPPAQTNTS
jgi:membrane protein YdbS with pleckstrin-like domain